MFLFAAFNVSAEPVVIIADGDGDKLAISSTGTIGIDATVTPAGTSSFTSGYRDVPTSGTAIALSSSVVILRLVVKASLDNTGNIFIGGSAVDQATENGFPLDAGEVWVGTPGDIANVFIDATVSGDSVGFSYESN